MIILLLRAFVKFSCLILILGLLPAFCRGQNKPGAGLAVWKAKDFIHVDGKLDEADWKEAKVATGFYLNFPTDTLPPQFQTEVRITFNDHFFYVSFVCYDDQRPNVVQSLRRDIDWSLNDNVGLYLDPYNDYTNGFYFTITPLGVQSEGLLAQGGTDPERSFNNNWDNKWYSAVSRHDDRWIAELAIPFKSFRYNQNEKEWNITFVRQDLKRNEVSSWIATPIQFIPASFAYAGRLQWQEPPPPAGTNISVIPYVVSALSKDREEGTSGHELTAGFDTKVAVTPALNLDLTLNPDFSTVEVDRQVINLTRFEFQFPERRQFFLENSDLFSDPGFGSLTQPFFSRRLGLTTDSSGNLSRVPILYGARLSGKLGPKWRVGLMNLHTREKASLGLPDQNYTMGIFQKQVLARSNFDFFIINKQSLGIGAYDSNKYYHESLVKRVWNGSDSVIRLNRYNRVAGFDFNLITEDNKWAGKMYYHHSFDDQSLGHAYSFGAFTGYTTRVLNLMAGTIGLGKNFNAETGFVPSLAVYPGLFGGVAIADFKAYPKSGPLVLFTPGAMVDFNIIPDGTLTDRTYTIRSVLNFRNTAMLTANLRHIFQKLPADFNVLDPKGDSFFLKGQEFQWNEFEVRYNSNTRKIFTYNVTLSGGEFYNGSRAGIAGTLSYRIQPYGSVSVTGDYNDIRLPPAYGSAKFLLLSPRLDFTLTDKLFLTTFVQYNDRHDNVNLNARFQWRYKPASDFFIVYTENYLPERLQSKNRALVFKFTYWLNL
jgi:hypothetical protein